MFSANRPFAEMANSDKYAAVVFVSALVASPVGAAVSVRTQPRALLALLAAIVVLAAIRIAFTAATGT